MITSSKKSKQIFLFKPEETDRGAEQLPDLDTSSIRCHNVTNSKIGRIWIAKMFDILGICSYKASLAK